jgi:hypothetical protein
VAVSYQLLRVIGQVGWRPRVTRLPRQVVGLAAVPLVHHHGVAGIDLDELLEEEPNDGWHWDPDNPPDEFNTSMIRRMSISTIRELQQPGNGILNEAQQRSFDAAFEAWWAPTRQQLADTVAAVMPKFNFNSIVGANLKASMDKLRKQTEAQLAASTRIDRSVEQLLPKASLDLRHARPIPAATSAGALEANVEDNARHLHVLEAIAGVLHRQEESATRGAFFYSIVSVMVIVAGVAPLVTMNTWADRLWTLGISAAIASAAGFVYWRVRIEQRRES